MSFIAAAGAVVGVVGGISKLVGASKAKKKAAEEQKKAQKEMDAKKKEYEALDTSNLAANQENKMEDLTINQKGMELQNQKGQQQRSNIMQNMQGAAGGSGIAALAQQMANSGQEAAQKSSAMIGDQEAANQKASSTEASRIQTSEIAGADAAREKQYDKTGNLLEMASGQVDSAKAAGAQASADKSAAIGGIASSVIGGISDRKAKKNINKIGVSPRGLNIYSFEYKNPIFGEGLFQGVMSDEVPVKAVFNVGDYEAVNYSMLDVEFKKI
jgi:hypothetical protein|tara:strand:- start:11632 stop:12444 length:813 start_codon:yes stop_codon:yes gene_type:complete